MVFRKLQFLICLTILSIELVAINVGGHITQDTTWTPDNNPYNVVAFIYVDTGVTLTIQPGVQILVDSADCDTNWQGVHWNGSSEPAMKMFIVYGKIIAIGTPQNNIIFDHYPDNPTWRWGGICFMPGAPHSIFEYCQINNTLLTYQTPSTVSEGALHIRNGGIRLRHSSILNYRIAVNGEYLDESLLLYDCDFTLEQELQYGYNPFTFAGEVFAPDKTFSLYSCSINGFDNGGGFSGFRYHEMINCTLINNSPRIFNHESLRDPLTYNSYGNKMIYSGFIDGHMPTLAAAVFASADTAYCRKNTIIANCPDYPPFCAFSASGDGGSLIIADNYGYGKVAVWSVLSSLIDVKVFNNVLHSTDSQPLKIGSFNGELYSPGKVYNNVFRSMRGVGPLLCHGNLPDISYNNNTFCGYSDGIFGNSISTFTNNIIAPAESVCYQWQFHEDIHEIFYNNCLSSALPNSILDGGGNIIANPMFADTLALDYHLQADSPCINAGIVTADMPEFDADYHLRGSSPDIGAYEYGSVYIGGIQGYVYDSQTRQVLDCAKIMIDGKLPEFSDSLGTFSYPTGTGIYTVSVKRFDYQDQIIPNVAVNIGDTIDLDIPMQLSTTESEDAVIPAVDECPVINNHPNPFRIETEISFILNAKGQTKVSIYNIKGQKISTLSDSFLDKGYHNFRWNGKDSSEKQCSNGIYFVRVEQAGSIKAHKLTLVR
jgi:hypothetical protein